jgi:hypothetical protein
MSHCRPFSISRMVMNRDFVKLLHKHSILFIIESRRETGERSSRH